MKTLLLSLCLLLSLGLFAQNQRYIYDYKLIKDSTNKASQRTETMYLDTSTDGSYFYSYTTYRGDSIVRSNLELQLKATGMINVKSDMKREGERYSVSKTYPNFNVEFYNRIGLDSYKVAEDRTLDWKILPDKKQIGQWKVQKASLDFAGRQWIAWFTSDIPLQDGPYKFSGLPGLIVHIEDASQSHIFELKGISNLSLSEYQAVRKPNKAISITKKQYQKRVEEYEKDPTQGFKQAVVGGIALLPSDDNKQWMKEREVKLKEEMKRDNNKIELSFN